MRPDNLACSRHQLLVVDAYLRSMSIDHAVFMTGIDKTKIEKILALWKKNNNCVIIESNFKKIKDEKIRKMY